jgi:YHS domain-containing protein
MKPFLIAALCGLTLIAAQAADQKAKCVVSGKEIVVTDKTPRVAIQGKTHYFCCENCPKAFAKTPDKFVKDAGDCPIIGGKNNTVDAGHRVVVNNGLWYICCEGCADGVITSTKVLKGLRDVVSGKTFDGTASSPRSAFQGQHYVFPNAEAKAAFDKEPAKYAVVYGK